MLSSSTENVCVAEKRVTFLMATIPNFLRFHCSCFLLVVFIFTRLPGREGRLQGFGDRGRTAVNEVPDEPLALQRWPKVRRAAVVIGCLPNNRAHRIRACSLGLGPALSRTCSPERWTWTQEAKILALHCFLTEMNCPHYMSLLAFDLMLVAPFYLSTVKAEDGDSSKNMSQTLLFSFHGCFIA